MAVIRGVIKTIKIKLRIIGRASNSKTINIWQVNSKETQDRRLDQVLLPRLNTLEIHQAENHQLLSDMHLNLKLITFRTNESTRMN